MPTTTCRSASSNKKIEISFMCHIHKNRSFNTPFPYEEFLIPMPSYSASIWETVKPFPNISFQGMHDKSHIHILMFNENILNSVK